MHKKKVKRLLSVAMAVCTILGQSYMLPVNAYAQETGESSTIEAAASGLKFTDGQNDIYNSSPDMKVSPGQSVVLRLPEFEIKEGHSVTYQWYKMPDNNHAEILEETGDTLMVDSVDYLTTYRCVISDETGYCITADMRVLVDTGLRFRDQYSVEWWHIDSRLEVEKGGEASLTVAPVVVNEGVELHYHWAVWEGDTPTTGKSGCTLIDNGTTATVSNIVSIETIRCTITDDYGNSIWYQRDVSAATGLTFVDSDNHTVNYSYEQKKVAYGEPATVSIDNVRVDEGYTLSYQWYEIKKYFDYVYQEEMSQGVPIEGAVQKEYTISAVDQKTELICMVTDSVGNSINASFTVYPDSGLCFTEIEEGQDDYWKWINGGSLKKDASTTIKVPAYKVADGVKCTYQWYTYDPNGPEGTMEQEISGATGDSYTVSDLKTATNYRCHITDEFGYSITCEYAMKVDTGLGFDPDGDGHRMDYFSPGPIKVKNGETTTVTAPPIGIDEGYTYTGQWYEYASWDNMTPLPGETGLSITTKPATSLTTYLYRVTDNCGGTADFTFFITPDTGLQFMDGQDWAQENIDIEPGKKITLNLPEYTISDGHSLLYQWREHVPVPGTDYNGPVDISGATGKTYEITSGNEEIHYSCMVQDEMGNQIYAHYYIRPATGLKFTDWEWEQKDHSDLVPMAGKPVELKTSAISIRDGYKVNYQWQKAYLDDLKKNPNEWECYIDIPGENGSTLKLSSWEEGVAYYFCRITDDYGHSLTECYMPFTTAGIKYAEPEKYPYGREIITVDYGESVTITLPKYTVDADTMVYTGWSVTEPGVWDYHWLDDANGKTEMVTGPITHNIIYASDVYSKAENDGLWTEHEIHIRSSLTVPENLNFVEEHGVVGEEVTLTSAAAAPGGETITYQWMEEISRMEDGEERWYSNPIAGQTDKTFTLSLEAGEGKTYTCEASDQYGNIVYQYFRVVADEEMAGLVETIEEAMQELDSIEESGTVDGEEKTAKEVIESITDNYNADQLKAAMESSQNVVSKIDSLEQQYLSTDTTIQTGTTVTEEAKAIISSGDAQTDAKISVTGLGLNAKSEEKLELLIQEVSEEEKLEVASDVVQIDITLEVTRTDSETAEETTEKVTEFKVPLYITVPVPAGMNANTLTIRHYHDNKDGEIIPYKNNNDGTVSFVVNKLSPFTFENCKHTGAVLINDKPATCAEEGYTGDMYCKDCDQLVEFGSNIPAAEHTFTSEITKAPSCRAYGVKTYTCEACHFTRTESIYMDESNHVNVEIRGDKAATCIEKGYTGDTYCKDCEEMIAAGSETEPGSHAYDSGVVTKPATCGEKGILTFTCAVCKGTKTEEISKLTDHQWNDGVITTAANCVEDGVLTYTCTVCGVTKTVAIPKTGKHVWDKGAVTTAATCGKDGVRTFTCTNCDATTTEVISKTGKHTWNQGTITKQPTYEAEGERTSNCTVCGASKVDKIAKLTVSPTRVLIESFVSRMFTKALGRKYDANGLKYWSDLLENHELDGANVAFGFFNSNEFLDKKVNNATFVNLLYATFFDREADRAGYNYWVGQLNKGVDRNIILGGFINSNEFEKLCKNAGIVRGFVLDDGTVVNTGIYNFVVRQYTCCLGREGEENGVEWWTLQIASKEQTAVDAAKNFFNSDEFVKKNLGNEDYIKTLYRTFMGREADASGLSYWKSEMASGMTRDQVLDGFASSNEFKKILEGFGL